MLWANTTQTVPLARILPAFLGRNCKTRWICLKIYIMRTKTPEKTVYVKFLCVTKCNATQISQRKFPPIAVADSPVLW